MAELRALPWLVLAHLVRIAREGLVIRALSWPALVSVVAILGSVAVVAAFSTTEPVVVSDDALAQRLEERGLPVRRDPDPRAALAAGEANRAVWKEGEQWVLGTLYGGRTTVEAEGVIRDMIGAPWTLRAPSTRRTDPRLGPITRRLLGLLGVLFTLYAVVFGAASLSRDREDGSLEAELALPLAPWVHPAARLIAAALALAIGFSLSVGLLHGVLGVDAPLGWLLTGAGASLAGTALGLGLSALAGRGESFSGPLARGMAVSTGLVGLGWSQPGVGRHLPIAQVGALIQGTDPSLGGLLGAALLGVLACWSFRWDR